MSDLLERRSRLLGPNVPTFYDDPVHIVRGEGVWLWDKDGRRYLDCYNNVPHVGHCHPKVVEAVCRQSATLNTHTRYLHEGILNYAERLTGHFGHDLSQVIMVCTGSEANDIALRMAQAVTGRTGFIATDNTYHGNTAAVSALSSRRPPVGGWPANIRRVPAPDSLNPLGGSLAAQPDAFAANVAKAIDELEAAGFGFAGFMFCPIFANEGLPEVGAQFLDPTAEVVRRAGGLMLCDEVQPGFGRCGTHWWGHDRIGISPDVVTLGKPMGNGYPVGAVVARPDVMGAFRAQFGYFNTFGGNPVACAAADAVLDVIEEDGLVEHAREVADDMLTLLRELRHPLIAGARAQGLFFAVELAKDGAPATAAAHHIVQRMRERGVLMGAIGRHQHILKLRPPMPFSRENAAMVADLLSDIFAAMPE